MQYLCVKSLTAGGVLYHPGEILPDGVILPKRSGKLLKSGYLSEIEQEREELRYPTAELQETTSGAYDGVIQISVRVASEEKEEQVIVILAKPEEIEQTFSILQQTAEDGAKTIAEVTSENVLILLHAADSRKTIKNAARERAERLFPAGDLKEVTTENEIVAPAKEVTTEGVT